jgi:dGTP triphosphohydrolase
MALPKLNDKPKYELIIPSSKQNVKFRPYLVKEEKVLMMALESQDKAASLNAVVDTISSCVQDEFDSSKLTLFDIEYMFIMIRSKSVGEVSQLGIKCKQCEKTNEIAVRLDDIEVKQDRIVEKDIKLEENITLSMKYPNFNDVLKFEDNNLTETEKTFILIGKCMESIETEEENIMLKDVSDTEVNDFIESLNTEQFTKVKEYVENMPRVEKEIKFVCGGCETENTMVLSGIDDFF